MALKSNIDSVSKKDRKGIGKVRWCFIVAAVLLGVMALIDCGKPKAVGKGLSEGGDGKLQGKWIEASEEAGIVKEYRYDIPAGTLVEDWFLYIKSRWSSYSVELDGECLYRHNTENRDGFTHVVPVPDNAAGKKLSILFYEDGQEDARIISNLEVFIGTRSELFLLVLRQNFYAVLFCCLALLLGCMIFGCGFVLGKALRKEVQEGIFYLGGFVWLAGIWVFTDSRLPLLLTLNTKMISFLSFISFFCMPFFMLAFIKRMLKGGHAFIGFLQGAFLVFLLDYLVNQLWALTPVLYCIIAEHLLSAVTMFWVLWEGFRELKEKKDPKLLRIMVGVVCFCIMTFGALIMFYLEKDVAYSVLYALGIVFFVFFLADGVLFEIYEEIKENADLNVYARLAYIDGMTGLKNRTAFMEEQEQDENYPGPLGYLMIDANGLKQVNDNLGHEKGDDLLISIAQCISNAVKEKGSCYRLGGDEFAVVLKNSTVLEIQSCIGKIRQNMEEKSRGKDYHLSAAIGYAWTERVPKELGKLLKQADTQMYKDKEMTKKEIR